MPKILLTNDDGIFSPGILTLKKKLDKLGEVVVAAPLRETSG
ncbi:5'/3'-nucleotidase SurE, partial [Candidatus Bathyarchaeota archaeon]